MSTARSRALVAALLLYSALASIVSAQDRLLQISGQPYYDGEVTLHVSAPESVGAPAVLAYGLDPLEVPVQLGLKGSWYIGQLFKLINLGAVPSGGRIDFPLTMPPESVGFTGLPIALQAFVPPFLSNPATLRLDLPYLTPADAVEVLPPLPTLGGNFGDRSVVGDFDGDGVNDLAVSATEEDYQTPISGSVYVLWGPDFSSFAVLRPPEPGWVTAFGLGLAAADFDQDGKDDLAITQLAPDPPEPTDFGHLYVAWGASDRQLSPTFTALSPGGGLDAVIFGRHIAAGDVTDDGIPDLVVGAPSTTTNGAPFGGAIVIFPGPSVDQPWVIPNPTPIASDLFGFEIQLIDMDDDGDLDIVEAGEHANLVDPVSQLPVVNAGELHIGYGPDFTTWHAIQSPFGVAEMDRFGQSLTVSDLDGDGLPEIGVADNHDNAFIIWGSGGAMTHIPKPPPSSQNPFGETSFGYSVVFFDANGDGLDDFLIGDPFDGSHGPCSPSSGGMIWAALAPHFATFMEVEPPNSGCGDLFGWPLTRHDLDGDGADELLAGADTTDAVGLQNSGRLIYYLGHRD